MNEEGLGEQVAYAFLRGETEQHLSQMCSLFKDRNANWESIKMFMVDKDATQMKVLHDHFKGANVFLCSFHVIKHWKKRIAELLLPRKAKKELLTTLASILYSDTHEQYRKCLEKFKCECHDQKFADYFLTQWDASKEDWAHLFRKNMPTMGNNTNNRIESHFQKLKKVLHQNLSICEALKELIEFVNIQECERSFHECSEITTQFFDTRAVSQTAVELSKILTEKAYRMVTEEWRKVEKESFTIVKEEECYCVQWLGKGRSKKNTVDKAMKTCSCSFSVSFGLPCAHILFCQKHENVQGLDPSCIHPRWIKRNEEVPQEVLNNGSERCRVISMPKSKFGSNDRFNTVCPIAMERASLIASCGGQEYQDKLQILTNLLNCWKINKQVVLIEMKSSTKKNNEDVDRQTLDPGDSQECLEISKETENVTINDRCIPIQTDEGVPELELNKNGTNAGGEEWSGLKITPVKSRRGRPKKQRNITFNKKGWQI